MDEPGGHYAKLDKSDIERQILYNITYVESKKYSKLVNKTKRSRLIDKDSKLMVISGRERTIQRWGSRRYKLLVIR